MPKKHQSEEQIISALKQYEGGEKTANICRKLGVSQATFYMWKKQYAGLGVQEMCWEDEGRFERKTIGKFVVLARHELMWVFLERPLGSGAGTPL